MISQLLFSWEKYKSNFTFPLPSWRRVNFKTSDSRVKRDQPMKSNKWNHPAKNTIYSSFLVVRIQYRYNFKQTLKAIRVISAERLCHLSSLIGQVPSKSDHSQGQITGWWPVTVTCKASTTNKLVLPIRWRTIHDNAVSQVRTFTDT